MRIFDKIRSHPRQQRGQSMVELAVSLMVLLWLLAGAIDFGLGFVSYVAVDDAAQEGASYGSVVNDGTLSVADCKTSIIDRVKNSSTSPVDLASTSVTITVLSPTELASPQSWCAGQPLKVTVRYDYPLMVPFLGLITGNPIHITASRTSTILTPPCP